MERKVLPVLGFDGYLISNYGEVYSLWQQGKGNLAFIGDSPKRLKTSIDGTGREVISFSKNGKRCSQKVCWLVLLAFVGPRPKNMQACHFPIRNPAQNRLDNLRWDTPSSNYADRVGHGTCNRGERNGSAKLTKESVISILALRAEGETYKALSVKFGVTSSNIQQICTKRSWKWV